MNYFFLFLLMTSPISLFCQQVQAPWEGLQVVSQGEWYVKVKPGTKQLEIRKIDGDGLLAKVTFSQSILAMRMLPVHRDASEKTERIGILFQGEKFFQLYNEKGYPSDPINGNTPFDIPSADAYRALSPEGEFSFFLSHQRPDGKAFVTYNRNSNERVRQGFPAWFCKDGLPIITAFAWIYPVPKDAFILNTLPVLCVGTSTGDLHLVESPAFDSVYNWNVNNNMIVSLAYNEEKQLIIGADATGNIFTYNLLHVIAAMQASKKK